ncbi:MAG TPA: NAD(P)H-hydrate epimerase [Elusimicrobiota bacterium]|nr:NAD(P)H-hydrate epimerase [Elusimicrobiota bacterium]
MSREPLPSSYEGLPTATARDMRALERLAGEKYGVASRDLMENAGRAAAAETIDFLKGKNPGSGPWRVAVFCGRGSNGGDGLAAARHLKGAGIEVSVFLCPPRKDGAGAGDYPELARAQLEKARAARISIAVWSSPEDARSALASADAVLDAVLGTGSSGKPAGPAREMIQAVARSAKPVVALDVPSGLSPDTGHHSGVYVTAELTLTLGLAKRGLLAPHAAKYVGKLKLLDIGYPRELLTAASAAQGPSR